MVQAITPKESSCCCKSGVAPSSDKWECFMTVIEKISFVGLAALSLYINWPLFTIFGSLGVLIGGYQFCCQDLKGNTKMGPSCTQGILEQVTGIKLPPLCALGVNVAITACHTWHHTTIFPPVIGLFSGIYMGRTLAQAVSWLCAKSWKIGFA